MKIGQKERKITSQFETFFEKIKFRIIASSWTQCETEKKGGESVVWLIKSYPGGIRSEN